MTKYGVGLFYREEIWGYRFIGQNVFVKKAVTLASKGSQPFYLMLK